MNTPLDELEMGAGGTIYSTAVTSESRLSAAIAAFERGQELRAQRNLAGAAILFRAARKLAQKGEHRFFRSAALRRELRANA